MVFNWFRRKFDQSADPQAEEKSVSTPQQEPLAETAKESENLDPNTSSAEVASLEQPTADAATDYLSFAKAAYKNIQQKQTQAAQEEQGSIEAPVVSVAADLPEVESIAPAAQETQPPTAATTDFEQESAPAVVHLPSGDEADTKALPEQQFVTAQNSQTDTSLPAAELAGTLAPASQTEATTPVPFWARAEADRQARLERLKATAIEVPEPEVVPVASDSLAVSSPTDSGLAFDEGFLWSTEILAAQGRRPEDVSIEEITWLKKLRQGLDKTRRNIVNQLKAIVGQGPLNQAAVMEIEALLLQADVGVEATEYIINALQNQLKKEALPPDAAIAYLKKILRDLLDRPLQTDSAIFAPQKDTLNIWLIAGVNGAGKTTTIGKLAHIAQKSGYKCLIGAADTFRAAAVEQVKVWGARSGIEVIANPGKNTDPAAVVFDAIAAATSRQTELLLIDTAGRLQNKKNLMEELGKIRRIIDKKAANAKVESLLVLDATLGQNGLRQAEIFASAAQLSGVVLTKLDGTAKGGVALAVVQQLNLPIRFIGAGEGIEDLRPFSSYEFVEALLSS